MAQVPSGCSCNEPCWSAHAATGWCLEATGDPVIVVTLIACDDSVVATQLVDPSTGSAIAQQGVVACQPIVNVTLDVPLTMCGEDEALRVSVCNAVTAVVQNLPIVDCDGSDAVRAFICNMVGIMLPPAMVADCDGSDALRVSVCNEPVVSPCELSSPLGHQQLSVSNTAVGLTVPVGAQFALIENSFAATQAVKWRDDGVSPTQDPGGIGHYLTPGTAFEYRGDLSAIKFIRRTGSGTATLEISYYSCA